MPLRSSGQNFEAGISGLLEEDISLPLALGEATAKAPDSKAATIIGLMIIFVKLILSTTNLYTTTKYALKLQLSTFCPIQITL